jgi:hypothetical protein
MFSFKPQIVNKSRNLAENYKKTFADRLTNIMQSESSLVHGGEDGFQPFNNFQTINHNLKPIDTSVQTFTKPATAFDHLYQHASYLTMKNQQRERERQTEKLREVERECTFKPQILSSEAREWGESVKRQLKQYEERKKVRQDKTTEEIEYEKGKNECTFKPTISQFKGANTSTSRKQFNNSRSRAGNESTANKGNKHQESRLSNY